MPTRFISSAGFVSADTPACIARVFAVGEAPANPSRIEQITCLDAMCTRREVRLCDSVD